CETRTDLASQAGQSCSETCGTAGYDSPQMIVIIETARPMSSGAYGDERVVRIIARDGRICMDYRKLSDIAIRNRCHQIRVYTKSKEEHESHLKMNLELLKKKKCYVKPNKAGCSEDVLLEALGVRDGECDLDGSRESTTHFQSEGLNMRHR
nr:hypothetical protein [Tanacetum cinerariifolium]